MGPYAVRLLLVVTACFPMAGCIGDSGGSASVEFSGEGVGGHTDSTNCNHDGTLFGSVDVASGSLLVRVLDGDNNEVYRREFGQGSYNLGGDRAVGTGGTWTLQATRIPDGFFGTFRGAYHISLGC